MNTGDSPRAESRVYISLIETADAWTKSFNSSKKKKKWWSCDRPGLKSILFKRSLLSLTRLFDLADTLRLSPSPFPSRAFFRTLIHNLELFCLFSLSLSFNFHLTRSYTAVQKYLYEHLPFLWNLCMLLLYNVQYMWKDMFVKECKILLILLMVHLIITICIMYVSQILYIYIQIS